MLTRFILVTLIVPILALSQSHTVNAEENYELTQDSFSLFGTLVNNPIIELLTDNQQAEIAYKKKKGKKKGKAKDTTGTYSGTFVLTKSKSFNGASCTPTQSFPATLVVSGSKNRPSGQLGNVPIAFTGKGDKKGARLTGNFSSDGISRKYIILIRKPKTTSAKITFSETVKSGKTKACFFKHSANFTRS